MLPKTIFSFVWYFLQDMKAIVSIFVVLAISAGLWGPFNSIIIKHIINLLPLVREGDTSILTIPVSLVIINFIVFNNFVWRSLTFIRCKYVPVVINRIIGELLGDYLDKSHQFYLNNLSGGITRQITNLSEGIEKIIKDITPNFLRGASLLLTALIVSYIVNSIFGIILLIWFIIFASISIFMSKRLVFLSDMQAASVSAITGELVDCLANHNNVRMFGRGSYEILRMKPFFIRQEKAYRATYLYLFSMQLIQGGSIALMMAVSCYFLVHFYGQKLVTIGDFTLILGLSAETSNIMWFTMSNIDEFNKILGKCRQSLRVLTTSPKIEDKQNAFDLKCKYGHIIFNNVKFSYQKTETFFHNKSIKIQAGQKLGLVGYSGSGKSTFVNLMLRIYDLESGTILIDDQDISLCTQASLRQNIAIIPQDAILFNRSLIDNIRYSRLEATDEEIIEAARKSYAHEFIVKLPQGYNTLVGERGIKLSGGERQRIAIARGFLKNSPILILDEATSQLDSITEELIQKSLCKLMQGKTTIVIAHRLSTLVHMSRILVFDGGKIVGDGSHSELLNTNMIYKQLWTTQMNGFLVDRS